MRFFLLLLIITINASCSPEPQNNIHAARTSDPLTQEERKKRAGLPNLSIEAAINGHCTKLLTDKTLYSVTDFPDKDECISVKTNGFIYSSARFLSEEGHMPLVIINKDKSEAKTNRIAIFLVGGPTGVIWHGYDHYATHLMKELAKRFDALIIPGYYGTSYRSAYPRYGIVAAAKELNIFEKHITALSPAQIYYISYSAGGDLLDTILENKTANNENLPASFFINPGLVTNSETITIRKRNTPGWEPPIITKITVLNDGEGYEFGYGYGRHPYYVSVEKFYATYFGRYYKKRSILDNDIYINQKHGCLKIIAGLNDKRIGVKESKRYPNRKAVTFIKGMDHIVDTPKERQHIYEHIDAMLNNPNCQSESRL